jgi:glucose/arabinose dehydrogenase
MKLIPLLLLSIIVSAPFLYASAQEDHEHADHAAESAGPSVSDSSLEVSKIAEGMLLPTAMAFLDEDRILVLEKDNGTVRMVEDGVLRDEPVLDVAVANENERGMLGIAAAVENDTTFVFLYFTESGGGIDGDDRTGTEPAGNRLYRYELENSSLVNPELLLDLPAVPGPRYNGGPVVVGPDGFVYVIIGDVEGHVTQAQNFEDGPAADGTSGILRVGMDGELPPSVIGTGLFGKYYYAYGIRNSFGMDFDPVTGKLWDTENGPATGDEINLVEPGFNSGWRDVFGMANETLDGLVLFNSVSRYSDPKLAWIEPIGPTALTFLDSDNLGEEYENDMFVGDILNGALYRFDLDQNRTDLALTGLLSDSVVDEPSENEEAIFGSNFGGITDIKVGTDGYLYVLSFVDGTIYRIAPSEEDEPAVPSPPTPQTPPTPPIRDTDRVIDLLIERFAVGLDNDSCFDQQDRRRLGNVISRIIEDMLGEDPISTDRLERVLDRIIEDCRDNDNRDDQDGVNRNEVNDDNRGPGNGNNGDNRGHGSGDDNRRDGREDDDDDHEDDDGDEDDD